MEFREIVTAVRAQGADVRLHGSVRHSSIPVDLRTGSEEQAAVRDLYERVGCKVYSTSSLRRTDADPGIADHIVLCRRKRGTRLAMWWHESKAGAGSQTSAQKKFQQEVEACGMIYVLGGVDAASAHLVASGILLRAL